MTDIVDTEPLDTSDVPPWATLLVHTGPESLLHVAGELDIASAPMLIAALDALIAEEEVVGLDLAGLTFMDAAGVSAISHAATTLGERGRIVLYDPTPPVRRLLELTEMSKIVDIDDDATSRSSGRWTARRYAT